MADDNCENCGSSRLKEFKYREGYGCWDCGYTSDEDASRMACSDCDSLVEDGSCLCGKTCTEASENSTERDFEDYFAANAPVDALSKMEKAVQLLETIDTEELRRTEQAMVSSALKSLRHSLQRWHSFRDEDTAGNSVQSNYTESGDSVKRKQTELEPAAWLVEKVDPAWSDNIQGTELVEKFTYVPAHERGDKEPLVRLSAVEEWYADILYQLSFLSNQMPDGAQEYLQRKSRELREFTQNDREDIVECSGCGMRQYRENWGGECLDCGATIGQNPVKRRCTDCGNEQEWPETPDGYVAECDECDGYMEDISQQGGSE